MTKADGQRKKIREALADGSYASWADLVRLGGTRRAVIGMVDSGELVSAGHNLYRLAETPVRFPDWLDIQQKYPKSVVCLLSAAVHHGLVNPILAVTYVGLPNGSRPSSPTVVGVQWPLLAKDGSEHPIWSLGVEQVHADGTVYHVTGVERTVVDLWRYRNKLPDGVRFANEAVVAFAGMGNRGGGRLEEMARKLGVSFAPLDVILTAHGALKNPY